MKTAFIFAAGRGERLRPLTDTHPKPLCPIGNSTIIERLVTSLAEANFERVIINHAYLGGQIRQKIGHGQRWGIHIHYAPEPPGALESGGAIVNALPLLGKNPFLTVNGDIVTDYPFASFKLPDEQLARIILVKKDTSFLQGDFGLSTENLVTNTDKHYIFAGIAYYHPQIFQNAPFGRYSLVPMLRQLSNDLYVGGELFHGKWLNVDSLERLRQAQQLIEN